MCARYTERLLTSTGGIDGFAAVDDIGLTAPTMRVDKFARPMDESRPYNNLLRALQEADYALIAPHLFVIQRNVNDVICDPGDDVEAVCFPCGPAMVSFLISSEDGRDVDTVLIGREGAVGGIVSRGRLPAYSRIVVKFGGDFVCLAIDDLASAQRKSPVLQNVFNRYADCFLAQIFQATACNAIHSIEQRAAKWMLAAAERMGNDIVPFTHKELAAMLGTGRTHTSRTQLVCAIGPVTQAQAPPWATGQRSVANLSKSLARRNKTWWRCVCDIRRGEASRWCGIVCNKSPRTLFSLGPLLPPQRGSLFWMPTPSCSS